MSEVIITVRGEHEARIFPEQAVARVTLRAEGPDRGRVVEQIAALASPLLDDLKSRKESGSLQDWSSEQVNIWASRPWAADGTQLGLVQYASLSLSATFTDFTTLSWWISEIAETEGVQIDGVAWQLTPETAASTEGQVAADAVRVAVDRATAYASAIGLTSVTPLEIADLGLLTRSEASAQPEMRMMKASFAADSGGAPPMEFHPQEIMVSAGVEARFTAR